MSCRILIAPYTTVLKSGGPHPKQYPWWDRVVKELWNKDYYLGQVGKGNEPKIPHCHEYHYDLSLCKIQRLLYQQFDMFMSLDSFLPHLAVDVGRRGVVLFSVSDPKIFGYFGNENLLKHPGYLRPNQFLLYRTEEYNINAFVSVQTVIEAVERLCNDI